MSAPSRMIPAPDGPLRLRCETPQDAPFLAALFAAGAAPMLRLAGLPEPQVEQLVAMQHRGQTQSYRANYPDGRFLIVERDGAPVGRLVEADEPGGVYVIDVAVAPESRGRGLGGALLADLQARQGLVGGRVRARVAQTNAASRRMFAKQGFVEAAAPGAVDLELTWTRPGCDQAFRSKHL